MIFVSYSMAKSVLFHLTTAGFVVVGIAGLIAARGPPPVLALWCACFCCLVCTRCIAAEGSTVPEKVRNYYA